MLLRTVETDNVDHHQLPIHDTFVLSGLYITQPRQREIYRLAYFNKRTNEDVHNTKTDEKFARLYCREFFRQGGGWTGLTVAIIEGYLRIGAPGTGFAIHPDDRRALLELEAREGGIPYDEELAVVFFNNAVDGRFQNPIVDWMKEINEQTDVAKAKQGKASAGSSAS